MYFTNGQTLRMVLAAAHTTNASHCVVSYADFDGPAVESTDITASNGTTAVTVVSDPTTADRILTQLVFYNNDTVETTVTFSFRASGTDYQVYKSKVPIGGSVVFNNGGKTRSGRVSVVSGWMTYDKRGRPLIGAARQGYPNYFYRPTHRKGSGATQGLSAAGAPQLVWIGQATKRFTSANVNYRVTTAATGVTWAELALCTAKVHIHQNGGHYIDGLAEFRARGYVDISGAITSTGLKNTGSFSVSNIQEGDDLFLAFSVTSTGAAVVRASTPTDTNWCLMWGAASSGFQFSTKLHTVFLAEPAEATDMVEVCAALT